MTGISIDIVMGKLSSKNCDAASAWINQMPFGNSYLLFGLPRRFLTERP